MGTFTTGGIAAEMSKFDRISKGADAALEKAVKAGGKALAGYLSEAAPVDTGALRDSIKAGKVEWGAAGEDRQHPGIWAQQHARQALVQPSGGGSYRRRGERHAKDL